MKKTTILFSSFYFLLSIFVFAHDADVVHPFTLSGKVMSILTPKKNPTDEQKKYQELQNYFYEEISETSGYSRSDGTYDRNKITRSGTLGTIEADGEPKPKVWWTHWGEFSLWLATITRTLNHFYNPRTYNGLLGFESATKTGKEGWNKAIELYGKGGTEEAYYCLGLVTHLLEDMSSNAHVYLDGHVGETAGYEHWVRDNRSILSDLYSESLLDIKTPSANANPSANGGTAQLSYDDFFHTIADETFRKSRIKGTLHVSTVTSCTGDLGVMFPEGQEDTQLSYLNYVDEKDGVYLDRWVISGAGEFSGDESEYSDDFAVTNEWWPINENGEDISLTYTPGTETYFYIECPAKCVPHKYVSSTGQIIDNPEKLALPAFRAGYPENLIPLAINYTAGFLKFYYDIVNPPPHVKKVTVMQAESLCYEGEWIKKTDSRELKLNEETKNINGKTNASVVVEFSEKVKEVEIKIGEKILDGTLNEEETIWTGILSASDINEIGEGDVSLEIMAKDKSNHLASRIPYGDVLDSDPSTIARATTGIGYPWETYEPGFNGNYNLRIDTTPAEIVYIEESGSYKNLSIAIKFSEAMDRKFLTANQIVLKNAETGEVIQGHVVIHNDREVTFFPFFELDKNTKYIVEINGVTDRANNETNDVEYKFETFEEKLFVVKIDPPFASIEQGKSQTHKVIIENKAMDTGTEFTIFPEVIKDIGWETDLNSIRGTFLIAKGETKEFVFTVDQKEAVDVFKGKIKVYAENEEEIAEVNDWSTEKHLRDHPDDNYSVSSSKYANTWFVDTESDIGVLLSGNGDAFGYLLGKYNIHIAPVTPELKIIGEENRKISDLKVLLIGAAALKGMRSEIFKQQLTDFVTNGGTIICLTQSYGTDFSVLPGDIAGYGWSEDQACHSNAVYIADNSPTFASQEKEILDIGIDGYFSKYPEGTKILLRRTKNLMPALIEYEYGSGKVIAGTMYSDWAYGHGQLTEADSCLMRDMVRYAVSSNEEMNEYRAGQMVIEPIEAPITKGGWGDLITECGGSISINVYDPSWNITHSEQQPIDETTTNINLSFTAPAALGIYTIGYTVTDSSGDVVYDCNIEDGMETAWKNKFIVNTPISIGGYSPGDFQIWATSPFEKVSKNDEVIYTIYVKNNTDTDFVNGTIGIGGHEKGGSWWIYYSSITGVNIPAHSEKTYTYSRNMPYPTSTYFGLVKEGQNPNNCFMQKSIIACEKGVWLTVPDVDVEIQTNKNIIVPGSSIEILCSVKGREEGMSSDAKIKLTVLTQDNAVMHSENINITLNGTQKIEKTSSYTIPLDAERGVRWIIKAEILKGMQILGVASKSLLAPFVSVVIEPDMPDVFIKGDNTVSFEIRNEDSVFSSDAGTFNVILKDGLGNIVYENDVMFNALEPSEKQSAEFTIPINSLVFGTYELEYIASFGETQKGKELIECGTVTEMNFDKSDYAIRENLDMELRVINSGRFEIENASVTISAPDCSFENTALIDLAPGEYKTISMNNISLPETLAAGQHNVYVSVKKSNIINKTYKYVIHSAKLETSLSNSFVSVGDLCVLTMKNTGGVDIHSGAYTLAIRDEEGIAVVNETGASSVLFAETGCETLTFDIPTDVKKGFYSVSFSLEDLTMGTTFYAVTKYIHIEAYTELDIESDKTAYTAGEEDVNLTSRVETQGALNNASLDMRVYNHNVGWRSFAIDGVINGGIATDENYVWFGTQYQGLLRYDKTTEEITRVGSANDGMYAIQKIALDGKYVWASDYDMMYRYHAVSNTWERFEGHEPYNFLVDENYVWMTDSNKMYRYRKSDGIFETVCAEYVGCDSALDGEYIWTDEYNRINKTTFEVANFFDESKGCVGAWTVTVDGNYVWFGGRDGATRYDKLNKTYTTFTTADGLITNQVEDILATDDSVWFATKSGVSRYLKVADTFVNYTQEDGMINNEIYYMAKDGNYVWFGNYWVGVSRYDTTAEWSIETISPINGISSVCTDDNYVWVYGYNGINRYDKKSNNWDVFQLGVDLRSKDAVSDGEYIWSGSDQNVMRYHKTDNTLETVQTLSSYIYDIACDDIYVWFCTGNGVERYHKINETWETFVSGAVYKNMTFDGQYIWFATYDQALKKYNIITETWENYLENQNGYIYQVIVDDNLVWVRGYDLDARYYYVSCYNKDTDEWTTHNQNDIGVNGIDEISSGFGEIWLLERYDKVKKYNKTNQTWLEVDVFSATNGQIKNDDIHNIVVGRDYLWFLIYEGLVRYKSREEIFQKTIPVSGFGSFTVSQDTLNLSDVGKYFFEGTLSSNRGQILAKDSGNFYVMPEGLKVYFETDKKIYKTSDTITITGEAQNQGVETETGLVLKIKQNDVVIHSETFDVEAGSTKTFSVSVTAEESFDLEVSVNDIILKDRVEVADPQIGITAAGPNSAGLDEFELSAIFQNTGKIPINITASFLNSTTNVMLLPTQYTLLSGTTEMTQSTTFYAMVTGDVSKTIEKIVTLGVIANMEVLPEDTYSEGVIEVPFNITNSGTFNLTTEITFALSGSTITKKYTIPANGGIFDSVIYPDITQGEYVLTYDSKLLNGTSLIRVSKMNIVDISDMLVTPSTSNVSVEAKIENKGANEFEGSLICDIGYFRENKALLLSIGEQKIYDSTYTSNVSAGIYDAVLQAKYSGSVIAESKKTFTLEPVCVVSSFTVQESYTVGSTGTITARVENHGTAGGFTKVFLNAGEFLQEEKEEWMDRGEEKEFEYNFTIPDDLEDKDYTGSIRVTSNQSIRVEEKVISFHVTGYKPEVEAELDNNKYVKGATSTLTMDVWSDNLLEPVVYAKVIAPGYECVIDTFTLTQTTQTLTFDIPVPNENFNSMFFTYGLYLESGRSLYLNTKYIYQKYDDINISLDKQVYNTGDTINISILADTTGYIDLTMHDTTQRIDVDTTSAILVSSNVPSALNSGTYFLNYSFTPCDDPEHKIETRIPYDVKGFEVLVKDTNLDKTQYKREEEIKIRFTLSSNQNLSDIKCKAWIQNREEVRGGSLCVQACDVAMSLDQGSKVYTLTSTAPYYTNGVIDIAYGFYKGSGEDSLLLANGRISCDVEPDTCPPNVEIQGICENQIFAAGDFIPIDYSINDTFDPNPRIRKAKLVDLEEGTEIEITSNTEVNTLDIDDGLWALVVEAEDWVGNRRTQVLSGFEVTHDTMPPRTSVNISGAQHEKNGTIFVSKETSFEVTAIDDYATFGDGTGDGVKNIFFDIKQGTKSISYIADVSSITARAGCALYTQSFKLTTEYFTVENIADAEYTFGSYAVDVWFNYRKACYSTINFTLDNTGPSASIEYQGKYRQENKTYLYRDATISLTADDTGSGVKNIKYILNSATYTYSSPFTLQVTELPVTEYKLGYYAEDELGNRGKIMWQDIVVIGVVPEVVSITPNITKYQKADNLKKLTFYFNENVIPKQGTSWSDTILIKNIKTEDNITGKYLYDNENHALLLTSTYTPNSIYEIKISSNSIIDYAGSGISDYTQVFRTLLERSHGGSIEKQEIKLEIPKDALMCDAVVDVEKENKQVHGTIRHRMKPFERARQYRVCIYDEEKNETNGMLNKSVILSADYKTLADKTQTACLIKNILCLHGKHMQEKSMLTWI